MCSSRLTTNVFRMQRKQMRRVTEMGIRNQFITQACNLFIVHYRWCSIAIDFTVLFWLSFPDAMKTCEPLCKQAVMASCSLVGHVKDRTGTKDRLCCTVSLCTVHWYMHDHSSTGDLIRFLCSYS